MIVYVVTEGSYSDYHIEAVFADKEQANLYLRIHPGCVIEEYDTEEIKIDAKAIRHEWTARISLDGELLTLHDNETIEPKEDGIELGRSFYHGVCFKVWLTTDRELERSVVEKACFDRVARFKAEYMGL